MVLLTECSLLPLFNPLLSHLFLGLYLLESIILLHYLFAVDEFFEIFLTIYSLNFGLHYHVVFYDFFHPDVGLVVGVVYRAVDAQVGLVNESVRELLGVMPTSTHGEHRMGSAVQLFGGFHGLNVHFLGFKLDGGLADPFV